MATRAQHRRETLVRLSDAAISSFETVGPSVTIEAIAAEAGVARRTVFRYVDSKEALAFIHPVLWFDVFDEALRAAAEGPLIDRVRIASRAIALHIDADPNPPRRAFAVVATHPELTRGFSGVFQQWVDRVAAEVLAVADEPDRPATQFRARIVGASVMGMVDAVVRQWVFAPAEVRFVDLYNEGFAVLPPLFEALPLRPETKDLQITEFDAPSVGIEVFHALRIEA